MESLDQEVKNYSQSHWLSELHLEVLLWAHRHFILQWQVTSPKLIPTLYKRLQMIPVQ